MSRAVPIDPAQRVAAKAAWVDRYRRHLTHALPQLAPIDAVRLALDAYARQHEPAACPDASAARYAAAREFLVG